jgi:hypothetical protein
MVWHAERSEASDAPATEMLRCAHHDKPGLVLVVHIPHRVPTTVVFAVAVASEVRILSSMFIIVL